MAADVADLILVRFAYVEDIDVVAAVEPGLQFTGSDLGNRRRRSRGFLAANTAEFRVVDKLCDGRMAPAHRAIRILAQLELAEFHPERIEQQQSPNQRVTLANNELERFSGLDGPDNSGEHAKHAALGAGRHQPWRRRFWVQAAVARAAGSAENRDLAFEAEYGAVNVGFAEQDAGVVHQVARGEIVGSIDDDVVVLEKIEGVLAREASFERVDLNQRVQVAQVLGRRFNLGTSHVARAEEHLALQIRKVDGVEIHQTDAAHASCREIEAQRRPKRS